MNPYGGYNFGNKCRTWFRRIKEGNFDLIDKQRKNRPRDVEDPNLQALLDEDDTKSQKKLQISKLLLKQLLSCDLRPRKVGI